MYAVRACIQIYLVIHANKITLLTKNVTVLTYTMYTFDDFRLIRFGLATIGSNMKRNVATQKLFTCVCILICRYYSHRKRLIKISCSLVVEMVWFVYANRHLESRENSIPHNLLHWMTWWISFLFKWACERYKCIPFYHLHVIGGWVKQERMRKCTCVHICMMRISLCGRQLLFRNT